MISRIRYVENMDGQIESLDLIQTETMKVRAKYTPSNKVVLIVDENNNTIDTWFSPNGHDAKKSIKEKLKTMGAKFKQESRKKKN